MATSRKKTRSRRPGPRTRRGLSRGKLAYIFEAVICLVVLGWLGHSFIGYVHASGEFQVKTIHVRGAVVLTPEEILEASQLTQDDNVLLMKKAKVRERVEAMPYVKHCTVYSVFPDTVTLEVEERKAVATLLIDNRAYEIDEECVILRYLDDDAPHVEPFITEIANLQFVELGEILDREPLWAALRVWEAFSNTSMADDVTVSEVSARHADDVRMYCDELPYVIHWGRGNFEVQARRLDALWREKGGRLACTEYLDLRWDEDLACK